MTYARTQATRTDRLHRRLMTSAAVAASLSALALSPSAHAQGVAGTGVVNSGTASITAPNASTTQVNTSSTQTVITWSPTDTAPTGGPINFLPAGNTLTFIGTAPGYTVLNRFLTSGLPINRQIALNGTVQSFQNTAGINTAGGNIWFYNAGGILIGSTGVINVGSLVLTANDIDTTGGLFGVGNEIRFRSASGSTSTVQVDAGASVTVANTNPGSAYFAMVAPRVVQRGVVSTDGSTAYVAAEQADIRINQGLFDINVLVGAEGGTVIDHTGTTTGPSANDGDPNDNRIYMVAIPKNDAVTMLVSGQVGYQDPVSAQVDPNGAIRLSAGYDIVNGEIAANPNPVSTAAANISVQDIIFNSDIIARASNDFVGAPVNTIYSGPPIFVPPPQQGRIRFNGSALLQGDNSARLSIGNQQQILAFGGLQLVAPGRAGDPGLAEINLNYNAAAPGARPGLGVTGGALQISAPGFTDPLTGNALGGTARLNVSGGLVSATDINISANGTGTYFGTTNGATGTGGTAELIVNGAGAVVQAVSITTSATGTGDGDDFNVNANQFVFAANGAAAIGGSASVTVSGGAALSALQALTINAGATGGTGSVTGGNATGGNAFLAVNGATSSVTSPVTIVDANAVGGGPVSTGPSTQSLVSVGGIALGGNATITSFGQLNTGATFINASASGGAANNNFNTGGNAFGGNARLAVLGGAATLDQLTLSGAALAGGGIETQPADDVGGTAFGGNASIEVTGAAVTISDVVNIDVQANTTGGSADITRERRGGNASVVANVGGSFTVANAFTVNATGGFDSSSGNDAQFSEDATGGNITLDANGGTIDLPDINLQADGLTSNASNSTGAGIGGTINLTATSGGSLGVDGGFNSISAIGFAGSGPVGGTGTGGNVLIRADNGTVTLGAFTSVDVGGTSGTSSTATAPTSGQGGTVTIESIGGLGTNLALGTLFVSAQGQTGVIDEGGFTVGGESAGGGIGGTIDVIISGGTVTGDNLFLSAEGLGGGADNGAGGTGTGGTVTFTQSGGNATLNNVNIGAEGTGGLGGAGAQSGIGTGGTILLNFEGGTLTAATFSADADGEGGQGSTGFIDETGPTLRPAGTGGNGVGGVVNANFNGTDVNFGTLDLEADGQGGDGGAYDGSDSTLNDVGAGGNGTGGNVQLNINAGVLLADAIQVSAAGEGGDGGNLFISSPSATLTGVLRGGDGGSGNGGTATVNLAAAFSSGGSVNLDVSAEGGAGSSGFNAESGSGGDANGGTAFVNQTNGFNQLIGLRVNARADGGAGGSGQVGGAVGTLTSLGGVGGNAVGGQITFESTGGAALEIDTPDIDASARGGSGGAAAGTNPQTGADGGTGTGGTINFIATDSSQLTITAPQGISAIGAGGNGGTGSFGTNGTTFENPASAGADGANGTLAGQAGGNGGVGSDGAPGGTGGRGGDGGTGGNGFGGSINLIAQQGGLLTNNVTFYSVAGFGGRGGIGGVGGFGGAGQGGGNGGNGGAGGPGGAGGNGGNGGRGGNGGAGGDGGNGGTGGEGFGGNLLVSANDGSVSLGSIEVDASGFAGANGEGGEGGFGGFFGEGGSGGLGGTSAVAAGVDGVAGQNGLFGTRGFEGAFGFDLARGGGGNITLQTLGDFASIVADDVLLTANAVGSFGGFFGSGGGIIFDLQAPSTEGPAVSLNLLIAQSFGSDTNNGLLGIDFDFGSTGIEILNGMQLGATDAIRIAGAGQGRLEVSGFADIFSDANVRFEMADAATFAVNGTLSIGARDAIRFSHTDRADGTATVSSTDNMTLTTFGDTFSTDTISSDDAAIVSAGGSLTVTTSPIGEVDFEELNALGGDLTVESGLVTLSNGNAGGSIFLTAGGINAVGGLTAGTDVIAVASGGMLVNFVSAGSNISLTSGFDINAVGPLSAGNDILIDAVQAVTIETATAGDDITINSLSLVASDLDATGNGSDNEEDGSNIRIDVGALATVNNANSAGDLVIDAGRVASGGLLTASGNIDITAADTILLNDVSANGDFDLTGSQIGFGELVSGGNVTLQTVPGAASPAGPPVGNGDIIGTGLLEASGTVTVTALRDVTLPDVLAGLDATITAGRNMIVARAETSGDLTLTALNGSVTSSLLESTDASISVTSASMTLGTVDASDAITLTSGTGGPISTGALLSGGDLTVDGGANVTISRFAVGGDADISAVGNVLVNQGVQNPVANTVAGNLDMAAPEIALQRTVVTGNADLNAVTSLTGQVEVGGTTALDADGGSIDLNLASTGLATASANDIIIRGINNNPLTFAQLTTDFGGAIINGSGTVTIQNATLANASEVRSSVGNVIINQATVTTGNLFVEADNDARLGRITVAGNLDVEAEDDIEVNDVLSAAGITLRSGDIIIGSAGRVGVLGTTDAVLVANNNPDVQTFVGGTGTRGGWHLDATEITQLFGGDITVRGIRVQVAQPTAVGFTRDPDVVVDDFAINAAQQFGAMGTFRVVTAGTGRVLGDVSFTNTGAGQTFDLEASGGVQVILGQGSIRLSGSAPDQLSGTLSLRGEDITVATAQAITDISGLIGSGANVDAVDARLAQNDGITSDIGALAADTVILDHSDDDSIYIQNSGAGTAFDQRRGISFGTGGLFINGPNSGDRLVINAVQRTAAGVVTGLAVIPLVTINGPLPNASPTGSPTTGPRVQTGFNPLSTINGCPLGNIASCSPAPPPPTTPESSFPVQDVIEEEIEREGSDEDGTGDQSVISPLITLRGLDPLTGEPLIDDPVTGAGNEDLWVPDE